MDKDKLMGIFLIAMGLFLIVQTIPAYYKFVLNEWIIGAIISYISGVAFFFLGLDYCSRNLIIM